MILVAKVLRQRLDLIIKLERQLHLCWQRLELLNQLGFALAAHAIAFPERDHNQHQRD